MKISVIIPFYNVGKYFEQCIESLLMQTYENLECIFVDDGSTDNSLEILRSKLPESDKYKVLIQENSGQNVARKRGFEFSTGDYIAFLDADDWVDKDFYEKLFLKAQEGDYDIVFSNTVIFEKGIYKHKNFIANQTYKNFIENDIYKKYANFIDIPVFWNKLYRREVFSESINYFPNIRKFEDNYFNYVITLQQPSVGYCFDTNIYYRIRENSVMTSIVNIDEHIECLKDNVNEIKMVVNRFDFSSSEVKDIYLQIAELCELKIYLAWFKKLKEDENIDYVTAVLKRIYNSNNKFITKKTRKKLCRMLDLNFLKRLFYINKKAQNRTVYQILGFKIKIKTKRSYEKNFIEKLKYDNENIILNSENFKIKSNNNKNNILVISDYFLEKGGIETRLGQYLKYLAGQNWGVYILSELNRNKELLSYSNFYLKYDALNFSDSLLSLIKKYNIKIVEFHFASSDYISNINIKEMKKYVRVGSVIHNKGVVNQDIIDKFDYNIIVSHWLRDTYYKKIKNYYIIPNSIENQKIKWENVGQKRAIFISRLDDEKLPTIEAFIEFCQENRIEFDIAGEENLTNKIIPCLIKKYNLSGENFIGSVDTISFLKNNREKYAFVGGVGLVILEAASLGYPCFCCSHLGKGYSSFITNENIQDFVSNNFTVKEANSKIVYQDKVLNLPKNDFDVYDLSGYVEANHNLNEFLDKYNNLISRFS